MASDAIFISLASIFLPRYSGVRPTISPATKTATTANMSMPYRPAPTPPKTTSPSWMRNSGTRPPSGVKESCIELTAPHETAVVAVAKSAESPRCRSAPPCLPCCRPAAARWRPGRRGARRAPGCRPARCATHRYEQRQEDDEHRREDRPALARVASPSCRTCRSAPRGITSRSRCSKKLVSGVGFSNGWAALALKKPPPLVPSCLMASCEATGPTART